MVRIATELASQRIQDQIEANARDERDPYSIEITSGELVAPASPADGVQEAFNLTPYAMRPAWIVSYKVGATDYERVYECVSRDEALTRLAADEPGAHSASTEQVEIPIDS